MSGFDRIKPPDPSGRRISEAEGAFDTHGRAALFTPPSDSVRAPAAMLSVTCSRCGGTAALDGATALRSAAPLFLVAPWRAHPVFAVCPTCGRRSWLRVHR